MWQTIYVKRDQLGNNITGKKQSHKALRTRIWPPKSSPISTWQLGKNDDILSVQPLVSLLGDAPEGLPSLLYILKTGCKGS
jgi:hypothetical protein